MSDLGATRVETVFREGPLQALTVETYAPDEADRFHRDHVTFTASDERADGTSALDADQVWALERLLADWRMARHYHAEAHGGFKVWFRSSDSLSVSINASREKAFAEARLLETCDDSWAYTLVAIEGPDGQLIDLDDYQRYADEEERRERESRVVLDRRRQEGVTEEWKIEVRSPESIRKFHSEWERKNQQSRDEWVQWHGTYSDEAGARTKSLEAVVAFGADRVRVVGGPVNVGARR